VGFSPYVLDLEAEDIVEVREAVRFFKGSCVLGLVQVQDVSLTCTDLELDGDDVTRERFPLPRLAGHLQKCALEVHQGTGLCVVRGLDPQDYSVEDNTLIFLGISCYLGGQRGVQSSKGAMLCMRPQLPA
jgi:hypothetical protein